MSDRTPAESERARSPLSPDAPGVMAPSSRDRRGAFLTDVIADLGFTDHEKIVDAVEISRRTAKPPEQCLLEIGAIDEHELSVAVAERNGLMYVDLDSFELDPAAAGLLSPSIASRYNALPIAFGPDGALVVAFEDPYDMLGTSDIEVVTQREVMPVTAAGSKVRAAIEQMRKAEAAQQDPPPAPWPEPTPPRIPEPQPQPDPELSPPRIPEPRPDPVPEPRPDPVPDPGPVPIPEPGPQPVPEPGPQPVPEPGPVPVPEPGPQPVPDLPETPEPEPYPEEPVARAASIASTMDPLAAGSNRDAAESRVDPDRLPGTVAELRHAVEQALRLTEEAERSLAEAEDARGRLDSLESALVEATGRAERAESALTDEQVRSEALERDLAESRKRVAEIEHRLEETSAVARSAREVSEKLIELTAEAGRTPG